MDCSKSETISEKNLVLEWIVTLTDLKTFYVWKTNKQCVITAVLLLFSQPFYYTIRKQKRIWSLKRQQNIIFHRLLSRENTVFHGHQVKKIDSMQNLHCYLSQSRRNHNSKSNYFTEVLRLCAACRRFIIKFAIYWHLLVSVGYSFQKTGGSQLPLWLKISWMFKI